MEQQKSAEAVVGWLPPAEGLNIGYESEPVDSMMLHTTARGKPHPTQTARPEACAGCLGCAVHHGINQNNSERG